MSGTSPAPTRDDPVARAGSDVLGGPAGRRLGGGGPAWARALPVVVAVTGLVLALGAATKHHCRAQGWNTPDQFVHACYADGPVVLTSSGLAAGGHPFGGGVELAQPPLTALLTWLLASLGPREASAAAQRAFFDASAVVLLVAALVTAVAVVQLAGARRGWDGLLLGASPVLLLAGTVSLDLVAVALGLAGLAAWSRGHPVAAGVLLGLAVAAGTWPVLLLLALVLLALRAGLLRRLVPTLLAAAGAWAAVTAPVALADASSWAEPATRLLGGRAGYGSPWLLPQLVQQAGGGGGAGLPGAAVTVLSLTAWAVWVLVVAVLVLAAPRRPRLPQVAFLLVAGVCALGPAFGVQASLWLLPLAALAVPRWRDHLVWWAAEAVYFAGLWQYLVTASAPERGLPPETYAVLLLLRLAGLAWLVAAVVRDVRRPAGESAGDPAGDVVRADGVDDPAGGALDGARDALVVRLG